MSCMTSAKYDMTAVVLKRAGSAEVDITGTWQYEEDPITGSIKRVWVRDVDSNKPGIQSYTIDCTCRGFVDAGIRVQGTQEKILAGEGTFEKIDYVKIQFGKQHHITDQDRITEIRWKKTGELVWREEERETYVNGIAQEVPTVFEIQGITPMISPFIGVTEKYGMLLRSEVQG